MSDTSANHPPAVVKPKRGCKPKNKPRTEEENNALAKLMSHLEAMKVLQAARDVEKVLPETRIGQQTISPRLVGGTSFTTEKNIPLSKDLPVIPKPKGQAGRDFTLCAKMGLLKSTKGLVTYNTLVDKYEWRNIAAANKALLFAIMRKHDPILKCFETGWASESMLSMITSPQIQRSEKAKEAKEAAKAERRKRRRLRHRVEVVDSDVEMPEFIKGSLGLQTNNGGENEMDERRSGKEGSVNRSSIGYEIVSDANI
ncbi:hypothetical protein F5876DRAFT_70803 [Lentinula aff. lateritia]|uniref:Uncharacterized protein n=1 Tax=Lentinula aff. lateritia TaxID=2804960 RepID=A0ACC1THU8_9AGAR|nr:hypothetical protein F5876DRAFT_70803 [Lentinula aff. lateritia]